MVQYITDRCGGNTVLLFPPTIYNKITRQMRHTYSYEDIRSMVNEANSEFRPKIGDGVVAADKKENQKFYKDTEKQCKAFDGGLKSVKAKENIRPADGNKGMLDFQPENVSKEYKDNVKARAMGYNSKTEKENGNERQGEYSDKNYKSMKAAGQEMHKNMKDFQRAGLRASKLPEKFFDKEDMYESKRPSKTAKFKRTEFLSEHHMTTKIPDDFKKDGLVFLMEDKNDSRYLCEWKDDKAVVLEHTNTEGYNNAVSRMRELMGYKTPSSNVKQKLSESDQIFKKTLATSRKIMS